MTIDIQSLYKRFGTQPVLRGVDLDIGDGELVALLGASGSGKTTLLRILAGLEFPDGGDVVVDGESWIAKPTQQRKVGFVFQHYALFGHLTVAENIAFGLRVRDRKIRPSEETIQAKINELLELIQLGKLGGRYPSQLSGGQRQRVALARALAIEPHVLLLDEPFGALDASVRKDLRHWLRELHRQLGMTTVFVTHDQEEALELADRVVILNEGRIEQIGTPEEVYDHPATPYVLRFLGGANELPGRLRAGRVEVDGIDTSAIERIAAGDGAASLFVRPHDIDVLPADDGAATVKSIYITGAQAHIDLSLGAQTAGAHTSVAAELRRDVARARGIKAGQRVKLKAVHGRLFIAPHAAGAMTAAQDADARACIARP
ncbi:MAG TPA: sulfate/molybdate ABC transporter ATP-binding protein [Alphaproteobacteria bacterium]